MYQKEFRRVLALVVCIFMLTTMLTVPAMAGVCPHCEGETVIRYEAYGFRFDEETEEWLLTKISVADEVEEIVEE